MAYLHVDAYNKALNNWKEYPLRKSLDSLLGGSSGESGFPTSAVSTVKVDRYVNGQQRMVKLTLSAVAQAVVNGTEHQGTKLADWPLGLVRVDACYGLIAQTTTSTIASTLNSGVTGALAFGTAASASTTLNGTAANLAPSTAFASSTTINVAGTAVSPILAAPIIINGSGTAMDFYINTAYATTTDVDADATQTLSGVIYVVYEMLTTGAIA